MRETTKTTVEMNINKQLLREGVSWSPPQKVCKNITPCQAPHFSTLPHSSKSQIAKSPLSMKQQLVSFELLEHQATWNISGQGCW